MLTVYDTAGNDWPDNLQYALCYTNGLYANVEYVKEHFPSAKIATISISAASGADFLDVENGDATVGQAIGALESGRFKGAYASLSTAAEIGAQINAPWNLWAADPNGIPHLPAAPRFATVVACQYAWTQLGQTQGKNVDISVALESLFDPPPPVPPAPPSTDYLSPDLELIVSLASSPADALNVYIRDRWATYRTDPLTEPALTYLHAGYSGPWAGSLDYVLACILDTARADGKLRPQFAGAV